MGMREKRKFGTASVVARSRRGGKMNGPAFDPDPAMAEVSRLRRENAILKRSLKEMQEQIEKLNYVCEKLHECVGDK